MKNIILLLLFLSSFALHAEDVLLDDKIKIWNKSAKELSKEMDVESYQSPDEYTHLKKKDPISIAGFPFQQILKFPKNQGLSEISYVFIAPKNTLRKTCMKVHDYLTQTYGKENHQKHRLESVGENDKNFEMVYAWHSLKNTSFEESCYSNKDENTIIITFYPKWDLFECVMHTAAHQHAQKYFFYLDEINQQARPYEKTKIAPPFPVSFTKDEIIFSNKDRTYQAHLTKGTNRLSVKIINPNGQIKILQGFCYKR